MNKYLINKNKSSNGKYKKERKKEEEMIDETIEESFPASDPPAWNMGIEKNKN